LKRPVGRQEIASLALEPGDSSWSAGATGITQAASANLARLRMPNLDLRDAAEEERIFSVA
jgi:hypothetical protein